MSILLIKFIDINVGLGQWKERREVFDNLNVSDLLTILNENMKLHEQDDSLENYTLSLGAG